MNGKPCAVNDAHREWVQVLEDIRHRFIDAASRALAREFCRDSELLVQKQNTGENSATELEILKRIAKSWFRQFSLSFVTVREKALWPVYS